jgi:DNA-binding CsgD family transcriptional regulator
MKRSAGLREPRICAHANELIEALIGSGKLVEAADAVARLQEEAETSSGQWSLASAARCRALLLAAQGRLDDALSAAEYALSTMDGLPMPFERARTQLVLGQLRRRHKEKRLARAALDEALAAFVALDTPVWAERARTELARIPLRQNTSGLTPIEETIARLVGAGLTNRDIADRTFLSPKTVESNLTRIYRKVGVRSRAGLAGLFPSSSSPTVDPGLERS